MSKWAIYHIILFDFNTTETGTGDTFSMLNSTHWFSTMIILYWYGSLVLNLLCAYFSFLPFTEQSTVFFCAIFCEGETQFNLKILDWKMCQRNEMKSKRRETIVLALCDDWTVHAHLITVRILFGCESNNKLVYMWNWVKRLKCVSEFSQADSNAKSTFNVLFACRQPTKTHVLLALTKLNWDWFAYCLLRRYIHTEAPTPQSQYPSIYIIHTYRFNGIDWSVRRLVAKSISVRWLDKCIESRLLPQANRLNTHQR